MKDIDLIEKEFFANKEELRARFLVYANFVEPFYTHLCALYPNGREDMLEKLMHTKLKIGSKQQLPNTVPFALGRKIDLIKMKQTKFSEEECYQDASAYFTWDDILDLKYTKPEFVLESEDNVLAFFIDTKQLMYNDGVWPHFEAANETNQFLFALAHLLVNKKSYFVPSWYAPQTVEGVLAQQTNSEVTDLEKFNIAKIIGGEFVRLFRTENNACGRLFRESAGARICLNAVISSFIHSYEAKKAGSDLVSFYVANPNIAYKPFVYLANMWNLVSGNELTYGLFRGGNFTRATQAFQTCFVGLARATSFSSQNNKVSYFILSYDNISYFINNMLMLADKKYESTKLSPQKDALYKFCRHKIADNETLLTYLDDIVDFGKNRQTAKALLEKYCRTNKRAAKKNVKSILQAENSA